MQTITYELKGSIALITLNRPDKLNSFNREMALLLQDSLKKAEEDSVVRAILITGAGKAFSAGQDLAEVTDPNGPSIGTILSEHYNPIVMQIRSIGKPIVAAINGVAAGAGANIALACDVVVAAASASFIQAFSKIGLIPDSGGTFTLPRLIGFQKASALMMLGEKVSAADAEKMGMIYKVFPDESFMDEAMKITEALSHLPTKGLALTKKALNQSAKNSLEVQLKEEDYFQQMAAETYDYREGVSAFVEKRKPLFKGE